MEEIALGEMGMGHEELETITPRSLFNKMSGYASRTRQEWERTRLMCFFAFSPINPNDPEKKTLMPVNEFMPLPWDGESRESAWEKIKEDAEAARKISREGWAKLEKKNNRDVEQ